MYITFPNKLKFPEKFYLMRLTDQVDDLEERSVEAEEMFGRVDILINCGGRIAKS